MGWLSVAFGVAASLLFYVQDRYVLLTAAVICCAATLWSYGVMHNYAIEAASQRTSFRGGFYDIEPSEADSVPDWLAGVNMGFSLISFGLCVASVVLIV